MLAVSAHNRYLHSMTKKPGNPNVGDKIKHPANQPVVIDGFRYPSRKAAALALGLHRNTITRMIKRQEAK